jgi:hypothetical protein
MRDLGEVYRASSKDLATNKATKTTGKMRQKIPYCYQFMA